MKNGLNRLSIRGKITLAFFISFVLISGVISVLLYFFLESTLEEAHLSTLNSEANELINEVDIDPLQIPISDIDQSFYVFYQNEYDYEDIYLKPGFVYDESILENLASPNDSNQMASFKGIVSDSVSYVYLSRPALDVNDGTIHLILSKNNRDFIEQLNQTSLYLILGNLLTAILSLTISYSLAGYSLRPIQTIISKANNIKASTQMDRLPMKNSRDEIAELSSTINEMISRIEGSIIEQNRFFASAAHELRTPLANMQSEIEYRMLHPSNESYKEFLESAREDVVRLKTVVQDFLLMSQLKQDKLVLKVQPTRLDDLVYDTLEKLRPDLKKAGFEVRLNLDTNLSKVGLDPGKMESLFMNLLDNARKHGDPSMPIDITLSKNHSAVDLIISNQVSRLEKHQGNGLGLWICQRICDLHGFKLHFKTDSDIFSISLEIPV